MTLVIACFITVSFLFVSAVFLEVVFGIIKKVRFETLIGYVLGTICLFSLFVLFFVAVFLK